MTETDVRKLLSTNEKAAEIGIKPDTLRHALCTRGHYFGLRPIKGPNRFLRWPPGWPPPCDDERKAGAA